MSSDWKTIRIESSPIEIIDGDRGVNYPKLEEFFEDGYCLFLNTSNVTKQGFNFSKTQFITKEKDSLLRKGKLKQFDIVLTTRGTVGNIAYFDEKIPYKNIRINSGMVIFRNTNMNVVSTKYFYQFLKSNLFHDQVISFSSGSAQPQLPISDLKQIEFPIPPLSIQNHIAEILSALDDKIELNRQTNATLEAIAQAIFKEWFVDFNYPGATGELVESELGPIPKGWRVGRLGEICELIKGVSYSSGELQPSNNALVTLKSINRGGGFNISGFKEYTGNYKLSQCLLEGDLIFAQTDITQNADVIGSPAIVENPLGYERLIASLDIVKCIPVNEMPSSRTLFYFLQRQEFKDYCLSQTNGSTVLHLRSSEVPNFSTIIPCPSILKNFDSLATTFTQNIFDNNRQNRILSELRDILLTKLMSGEINLWNG